MENRKKLSEARIIIIIIMVNAKTHHNDKLLTALLLLHSTIQLYEFRPEISRFHKLETELRPMLWLFTIHV